MKVLKVQGLPKLLLFVDGVEKMAYVAVHQLSKIRSEL